VLWLHFVIFGATFCCCITAVLLLYCCITAVLLQEYHLPRVIKQLAVSLEQKKPLLLHGLKFWCVNFQAHLRLCVGVLIRLNFPN
jgi:hypothetical protein